MRNASDLLVDLATRVSAEAASLIEAGREGPGMDAYDLAGEILDLADMLGRLAW